MSTMPLRPLGDSGLMVTPLGLGLAALGRPGYINIGHSEDLAGGRSQQALREHSHAMLDLAWRLGMRYVDVARSYGKGEAFLGDWLHAHQHDDVVVGSKWGYTYTANWQVDAAQHEVKSHDLATLQRQWRETQITVGKHLDLYQIHSATFESGVLDDTAVLAELARLRAEFGIAIGLTLSGPNQPAVLARALACQIDGQRVFDTVQITFNLLETSAAPVLAEARSAGMGVIVKEALANGRLTRRNVDPGFAPTLHRLEAIGQAVGATVDALALAFVLAQPWADVVLSGAAREQHLRSNARALHVTLDDGVLAELRGLAEPPDTYWGVRQQLTWN